MAKITIEIDTHDDLDARDEALLSVLGSYTTAVRPVMMTGPAGPTAVAHMDDNHLATVTANETPAPPPAKRGRKPAAAAAPDPAAGLFETPASEGNGLDMAPASDVTLPMINALLVSLLAPGAGHNAEELTKIVEEVTGGAAISPKHCDPKFWPEIHARFSALAAN